MEKQDSRLLIAFQYFNTPVLYNLNLLKCKIYKSENNG